MSSTGSVMSVIFAIETTPSKFFYVEVSLMGLLPDIFINTLFFLASTILTFELISASLNICTLV